MSLKSVIFDEDRVVPVLVCKDKSLTQQSFKDECDINKIMSQFDKTGLVTHVSDRTAIFGDVSSIPDYYGALLLVQEARDAFMTLSAELRNRFDNDPGKLIEFLENEENREEAVKLGIIEAKKPEGVEVPKAPVQPVSGASEGTTK